MIFQPKSPDHSVNVSSTNEFKDFILLTLSLLAILAGISLLFFSLSDYFVEKISLKTEAHLASRLNLKSYQNTQQLSPENNIYQLTQDLWKPYNIEKVPIEVNVVQLKSENAFMTLGGRLLLTSELLHHTENENDLAFVICHELGHFYLRHVIKLQSHRVLLALGLQAIALSNFDAEMLQGLAQLTELSFNRSQEAAADHFALSCMNQKYGHIAGFDRFFRRVINKNRQSVVNTDHLTYFSTHPGTEDRIEQMKSEATEMGISLEGNTTPIRILLEIK
ncbi:MAG: M48 family metallopeptidase [Bdellovibrionales bacterium]|nr:M48 family metallopeptidase [Bdellovibrionales bacterium]